MIVWINNKNKQEYIVLFEVINKTNKNDNEILVIYQLNNRDKHWRFIPEIDRTKYAREIQEFNQKFTKYNKPTICTECDIEHLATNFNGHCSENCERWSEY